MAYCLERLNIFVITVSSSELPAFEHHKLWCLQTLCWLPGERSLPIGLLIWLIFLGMNVLNIYYFNDEGHEIKYVSFVLFLLPMVVDIENNDSLLNFNGVQWLVIINNLY